MANRREENRSDEIEGVDLGGLRKGFIKNDVLYEYTLGGPSKRIGRVREDGFIYEPTLGEPDKIIGRVRSLLEK